jgi:hypothetical protein
MKTSLRVLFVIQGRHINPFINILAEGISSDHFLVDSSISAFWNRKQTYDIIQIHWPEILFYSNRQRIPTREYGEHLYNVLYQWKKNGAKIVYTRHDETTHYVMSPEVRTNLYEVIESEADAIVHLGYFSKRQMIGGQPVIRPSHVVIPHHIYDTFYPRTISRSEARKALGIKEEYKVILTFGTFRDKEEHLLVKNVFEQIDEPGKYLFAPAWYHNGRDEYQNTQIIPKGNSWLGRGTVDQDMLPYCFAAADVIFIQRVRNLNSGNLPMGFFFNKTVVGPAVGNMTEYLDNRHNFSFDPFDSSSVLKALERGIERSKYPQVNEAYARKHWNTATICDAYRQLYQQLINQ